MVLLIIHKSYMPKQKPIQFNLKKKGISLKQSEKKPQVNQKEQIKRNMNKFQVQPLYRWHDREENNTKQKSVNKNEQNIAKMQNYSPSQEKHISRNKKIFLDKLYDKINEKKAQNKNRKQTWFQDLKSQVKCTQAQNPQLKRTQVEVTTKSMSHCQKNQSIINKYKKKGANPKLKRIQTQSVYQQEDDFNQKIEIRNPQDDHLLSQKMQNQTKQSANEQKLLQFQTLDDDFWNFILGQNRHFSKQQCTMIQTKVNQELTKYQVLQNYFEERLTILNNLVLFYDNMEVKEESKITNIYDNVMLISQKYYHKNDQRIFLAKNNLACHLCKSEGKYKEGIMIFKECLNLALLRTHPQIHELIEANKKYFSQEMAKKVQKL